jgi:hypothetical protein
MNASFIKQSYIEMRALRARHFFLFTGDEEGAGRGDKEAEEGETHF